MPKHILIFTDYAFIYRVNKPIHSARSERLIYVLPIPLLPFWCSEGIENPSRIFYGKTVGSQNRIKKKFIDVLNNARKTKQKKKLLLKKRTQ